MAMVCEIRGIYPPDGSGARYPIFSLQEDGQSFFILIPSAPLGAATTEVYRVANAVASFIAGESQVEIRGRCSSFDPITGVSNPDAWVELRINGRVYADGDDFLAIDPLSAPSGCLRGKSGLNTQNQFGWQVGSYVDTNLLCCYLSDTSAYCRSQPILAGSSASGGSGAAPGPVAGVCPPPGPGGSSFDGSPEGDRSVVEGGAEPEYTPPAGEGLPATASDETDAQTLSAMTGPLVSLDLTLVDASVLSFAKLPIVRAGVQGSQGGVVRWGDVSYPLSDRFGNLQAQVWEVEIADVDGAIRALLASGANRFYKRWEGRLYAEDNAARLAGTARRSIARGRCVTVRTDRDLVVTLVFSDEFSRHDSPYSLDRELPHVLIGDVFSDHTTGTGVRQVTDPSEQMASTPTPILYGECSDEYRADENPPVTPIGICKLHYVGDVRLSGSETWHGYLVCLYAVYSIPAIFGSNQHPECPASVRLNVDSSAFLIPGHGAWDTYFSTDYLDLTKDGVTHRVTMIFGRGPVSQAHVDGKVPLSCNVNGIEAVGDGSGALIDDGASIVQHLLDHPILRSTKTGTWGAIAAFPDGVAKIKSSDFTAVKAEHDTRIRDATGALPPPDPPFNWIQVNSDFSTDPADPDSWFDADFTGTGWSWDGSKAVHTPGTAGALRAEALAGEGLYVRFDLIGFTAGTLFVSLWDGGAFEVTGFDAGTRALYFFIDIGANGSGDSALLFDVSSDFNGAIDNVTAYTAADEFPEEVAGARLGYRGALIIDQRRAARDWLADALVSYDMRIGLNHHGQVTAMTPTTVPTLTALTTFTDGQHVQDGSFRLTSELNAELENRVAYEFGPEPASGRVIGGHRTVQAAASVTSWGDTYKGQPIRFVGIYRKPVAQDVASRRLAVTQDGITRGEFVVDLAGGDLAGGQLVRLTHFAGLGTTGWRQRLLMATTRVLHLNEDALTTTVTWEDQQTGLVAPAGMVGGGVTSDGITTTLVGFHPMGDNGSGTGWRMGSTSAGTAWRMG